MDTTLPLTFMLGFFVTQVVSRWSSILNGLGWIDDSALAFANYIRGADIETRILRRNMVRYMVLNQAIVLRDISMQVRKRFPTLETLAATGIVSMSELEMLERVHDPYSRYWTPIHWCYALLYEARLHGKVASDFLLDKITSEIRQFRHGLASLLKYDWVVTLQLLQIVLISVAEALLNPFGEDDDDLECNYVIDKNLITGMTLVDLGSNRIPDQKRDYFWDEDHIVPLYSLEAAKRTVHPMIGSASKINLVEKQANVTMAPHKSKLSKMDEQAQKAHIHIINVEAHNRRHSNELKNEKGAIDDDTALSKISKRNTKQNWFGKLLRRRKQKGHQIPVQYTPGVNEKRHDSPAGDEHLPYYQRSPPRSPPLDYTLGETRRDYSPYGRGSEGGTLGLRRY
uniref:Bestrophin homolog n=1 Tax=Meloidogyne javanica TaxID=6303 RepID=A0A915N8F6_MELJA